MCEFCKNLCNSDNVDSVHLDRVDIGEIMGRELSMSMDLDCYESGEHGLYKISTVFDIEGLNLDAVASIKIHYCPFCGRKLD